MSDLVSDCNEIARSWLALPENEREEFRRALAARAAYWRTPERERAAYARFRAAVKLPPRRDLPKF